MKYMKKKYLIVLLLLPLLLTGCGKKDIETFKGILLELKKSHTIIVIDREQNIDDISDHIVVIDEHTVKEEGTRTELIKKKAFYYNLIGKNK